MVILKIETLQLGDIILIKSNNPLSERIRKLSNSNFSHAMIYVGASTYIDADVHGVQSNNIQRKLFDSEDDVKVLRLKDKSLINDLVKVTNFARSKVGTEYSITEAKKTIESTNDFSAIEPNRQFCTRFVAQSYQAASINVTTNPDYCVPDDLLNSKDLIEILNVTRTASNDDIEFAKSDSEISTQVDMHNIIFEKARKISGSDIQNFPQLDDLIKSREDLDSEISGFIKNSGYLDLMDKDFEKNPHHYSIDLFEKFYKENSLVAAHQILDIDLKLTDGYLNTMNNYILHDNKNSRIYYKMQISLFEKLLQYSSKRSSVSKGIILKYS